MKQKNLVKPSDKNSPESTHKGKRTALLCLKIIAISGLLAIAGLQHFSLTLPQSQNGLPKTADGLVVPTGGQARIQEGLRLLEHGIARRMLITGVGQNISKQVLGAELALSPRQLSEFECCVDIEKAARDTRGNAQAALNWAKQQQFTKLGLVTANYHLPRASLEFSRLLPHMEVTGWPVEPPDLQPRHWYKHWPTTRLLAREYAKYVLAWVWL